MLQSIKIRNFKKVVDKDKLFEYPFEIDEEEKNDSQALYYWSKDEIYKYKPLILNNLSQINYLVGKNGSGKSSILEALLTFSLNNRQFYDFFESFIYPKIEPKELDLTQLKDHFVQTEPIKQSKLILNNENTYVLPNDKTKKFEKNILTDEVILIRCDAYDGLDHNLMGTYIGSPENDVFKLWKKGLPIVKLSDLRFMAFLTDEKVLAQDYSKQSPVNSYGDLGFEHGGNNYEEFIQKFESKTKFKLSLEGGYRQESSSSGKFALSILLKIYSIITKQPFFKKIILIEEPETSLHPQFQKQFPHILELILYRLKQTHEELFCNIQFFITTHSNYLISAALEQNEEEKEKFNLLNKKEFKTAEEVKEFEYLSKFYGLLEPKTSQNVYLLEDGQNTKSDGGPIDFSQFDNALGNLGVQPSDLLFANGVIWVEGHTDVLVISALLDIIQRDKLKKYKEGLDFSFQVLATSIWKHAGFWFFDKERDINEKETNNIVNLFQISRKNLIILDGDGNYTGEFKPSEHISFIDATGGNKAKLIKNYLKVSNFKEDILLKPYNGIYKDMNEDVLLAFWVNDSTLENFFKLLKPKYKAKIKDLNDLLMKKKSLYKIKKTITKIEAGYDKKVGRVSKIKKLNLR
jgi:AAA15 family ATPase/GTPase